MHDTDAEFCCFYLDNDSIECDMQKNQLNIKRHCVTSLLFYVSLLISGLAYLKLLRVQ